MKNNKAIRILERKRGNLPLTSVAEEALVLSASYAKNPGPILVLKNNLYQAQRLYERTASLIGEENCALFGSDESLRVASIASSPELKAAKIETLSALIERPEQIVITCPSAFLRQLPSKQMFENACIDIGISRELNMSDLKQRLISSGYQQTAHIDQPLTFAMRGGITDIYSINYENPVRIEFFDTEVDSIRFFDVMTQKTTSMTDHVRIMPASDVFFNDEQIKEIIKKVQILIRENDITFTSEIESQLMAMEEHVFDDSMYQYMSLLSDTAGIWDYMNAPVIICSDMQRINESVKHLTEDSIAYIQEMAQEGKMLPRFAVWHDFSRCAKGCRRVIEDPFEDNIAEIEEIHISSESLPVRLKQIDIEKRNVFVLPEKEMKIIRNTLDDLMIPYSEFKDRPEKGISLLEGELVQGFRIVSEDLSVYTSTELFEIKRHAGRYENRFRSAEVIRSYDELKPGDYIVHASYGVGQFVGIETREVQSVKRDFLKIVYRGNAELLVPLEQFRLVRKFVSREGVVPKLNKLGTQEWEKTKKKLEENVNDIAERLLSLYANREQDIGYAFSKDNEMTKKFEDAFLFELTPDQQKAVEDVKKDMESDKPMDRLICGDVGFGKTEVAVRASFKAVSDGKQTAVLCPTTILAEQHYNTFLERYRGYPVTVRVLDRFVLPSEQKKILLELKEGNADILIGTHRILSKDVVFKDLGLLVVDEEQRFGVEHKERIKEMKNGIDVLTLSATPIPRTLQMSLVGIRSLSQLDTPPLNRYSVQTYVAEKNSQLIADAIMKELARDGQVFYLFNNIDRIYNTARTIRQMVPDAEIGIVHGRMNREDIEDVMMRFKKHEIDILVCTTIVENGIDIPNVNTIIIENAQDFGLAQLYQIKGRVGRSDRIAYAYLLIPPHRQLSETASKRLQAIKEFARLGSGYRIAMRDLTIRGAGSLLGSDQSGFIDTVGIDMYIEMLENAIRTKKGEKPVSSEPQPHVNIQKTSYIPENFAANDFDKLNMYQTIDTFSDLNNLENYKADIIDQYGRLPAEVDMLFMKRKLDIMTQDPDVESYKEISGQSRITFSEDFSSKVDGVRLFQSFTKISRDITIRYTDKRITAVLPRSKDNLNMAAEVISKAKEAVKHEN